MNEYPNLPIKDHGPINLLQINQLPKEYEVFQKGVKKGHFVHELNLTREVISKGTAICGRSVQRIESDNEIPVSSCCVDCLDKMNEKMEGWLFDEKNREYYDPMKE